MLETRYVVSAIRCELSYVGETKYSMEYRLKQHLYNIQKTLFNTLLVQHFQNHPVAGLCIDGLQTDPVWTRGSRRRMEQRWISKLDTITRGPQLRK